MFKPARWRSEKMIKIEPFFFKLQFQATQVPKLGWEALIVTLVPMDVGRPTARSDKAAVINGACRWENPIYERVKLTQDSKTGKLDDKDYRFLVSATRSMKSGILGEVTINFADYAEVFKPTSVSLPLEAENTGAILHVTLHRVQGDVEGRVADENGDLTVRKQRKTLHSQLINCDNKEGGQVSNGANDMDATENGSLIINRQSQVKFPSSTNISLRADSNDNLKKSSSFDAISSSSSETGSGQFTPKENDGIKNNNTYQNSASFLSPLSNSDILRKPMTRSSDSITNTNWFVSSAPNGSMGGSTNTSGETGLRERLQESDDSRHKLTSDAVALQRELDVSKLELQTLRRKVVKENRRGQDQVKELSGLTEERDAFRRECEELKASQKRKIGHENVPNNLLFDGGWSMLEEIKQELNHEKHLSANLFLQLQKTQEANSELILAVRDLEELLDQRNNLVSCTNCSTVPVKSKPNKDLKEAEIGNGLPHSQNPESTQEPFKTTTESEEQYALDVLVKEPNAIKCYTLEQEIIDLNSMEELYQKDREDIEVQMEQLALDYEILKQENHYMSSKLEQTNLREQLMMQYECSEHLAIINDLEAHVENLEKELQEQVEAFEADLEIITKAKVEQQQRAIQSEEALRNIRLSNANTAERLQEEFKLLSAQMSSTFYANEKLLMQSRAESNELCLQKSHLEELLEKTNKELESVKGQCHAKFQQLLSLIEFKTKEADRLFLGLKDKQNELENQKKSEGERQKASAEEIILLKVEMEKLSAERNHLFEQIEHKEKMVAEMKISIKENEISLQERNMEINLLQVELAAIREEANKSMEELNYLKQIMDEQETMIRNLNSEVATLRMLHFDLKDNLLRDELEKENLKQQVLKLSGDIKKNEGMITSFEIKIEDSNTEMTDLEESRNLLLQEDDFSDKIAEVERISRKFNRNNSGLCEGGAPKENLFNRQHGNVLVDEKVRASYLAQLNNTKLQDGR